MKISGIYSITNLTNGKVYYGSSNDAKARLRVHKSRLTKRNHVNPHLQNAWNKYGENNFEFKIIEEVPLIDLQLIEQSYLNWCKMFPRWSYNIGYDATCATRGLKFGPPSDEHRLKISLSKRGEKSPNFGKKLSLEIRMKMSLAKKGKSQLPFTEKHKQKLSDTCKGNKHYRYDNLVYTFFHPTLGIEKCNRHELSHKYNLHKRGLGMVIENKRKTYKNWRIQWPI